MVQVSVAETEPFQNCPESISGGLGAAAMLVAGVELLTVSIGAVCALAEITAVANARMNGKVALKCIGMSFAPPFIRVSVLEC